jgi:hypothetical protein
MGVFNGTSLTAKILNGHLLSTSAHVFLLRGGASVHYPMETPADVRFQCCTEAPCELDRTLEVMCLVSSDVARQLRNPIPVQLPTPAVMIARFCDAMLAIGWRSFVSDCFSLA